MEENPRRFSDGWSSIYLDAERPDGTSLSSTTHVSNAKASVAWLDAQKAVDSRPKIGITGYCMAGPISLASMGTNGVAITTTAGKTVIVQGPDL